MGEHFFGPGMDTGELKTTAEVLGYRPDMYTTNELLFMHGVIGSLYVTGYITKKEYKQISKQTFPTYEQPLKKQHKRFMKSGQAEVHLYPFNNIEIDHHELLAFVLKANGLDKKPVPFSRVGEVLITFDSKDAFNRFEEAIHE